MYDERNAMLIVTTAISGSGRGEYLEALTRLSRRNKKKIKEKTHIYFVKKVSFMNKLLVIKKYIGLDSSTFSKEKYILDNL